MLLLGRFNMHLYVCHDVNFCKHWFRNQCDEKHLSLCWTRSSGSKQCIAHPRCIIDGKNNTRRHAELGHRYSKYNSMHNKTERGRLTKLSKLQLSTIRLESDSLDFLISRFNWNIFVNGSDCTNKRYVLEEWYVRNYKFIERIKISRHPSFKWPMIAKFKINESARRFIFILFVPVEFWQMS